MVKATIFPSPECRFRKPLALPAALVGMAPAPCRRSGDHGLRPGGLMVIEPSLEVSQVMGVPPNHPILIGFSFINHPFWGTPHLWKHPRLLRGAEASILCTVVLQVTSWRGSRFQFETVETQSLGVVQFSTQLKLSGPNAPGDLAVS